MGLKSSSLLCLTMILALSSTIHGLDITKLLGQYPEFSLLNKYLTDTKLAEQINSRIGVTILAVDDQALSSLSGESLETIKAILSSNILANYYDEKKLVEAQGAHSKVETLFQSSGLAKNNQGYIYVYLVGEGAVAFGSAVNDEPTDVELMGTVMTQPETVSIMHITRPIVAPGINALTAGIGSVKVTKSAAQSPVAAEAPGSNSGSGRVHVGLVGAVSALASLVSMFV
ncbi:fasciclin-like arabinogalactan protein 3 [Abrus precatorius]|uniref:Fasciclin-like arabinogalactan protein 3 n=1 Tax=Abrus precatorius TaxID=3816 RepID=A0A8B8LKH0_ABRPR|nr:fasciclin-like arabinogalactan protein 3 [Abrus precatorius]